FKKKRCVDLFIQEARSMPHRTPKRGGTPLNPPENVFLASFCIKSHPSAFILQIIPYFSQYLQNLLSVLHLCLSGIFKAVQLEKKDSGVGIYASRCLTNLSLLNAET